MNVFPTQPLIATQWNGHGDHPQVWRMNGHNWEWFPNEDDTDCGLLFGGHTGCIGMVHKGDWIVECPTLRTSRIFKPAEFAKQFSIQPADTEALPSLENDSLEDENIASVSYRLCKRHDGVMTNAVELLVRPLDIRGDESGEHPDESGFVMLTITREEIRAMLRLLDEDWSDIVAFTGNPNAQVLE